MGTGGSTDTGRVGSGMFGFRVEFSLQCPRCDRPVPLDGPVERVHCGSCQSDIDIPRSYWIETLENSCRKMQETEVGTGTGSMLIGTFHGNLTLARFAPYCDSCKTDFDDPWDMEDGTACVCAECGMVYPVRKPPDWLASAVPRIRVLVNALFTDDTGGMSPRHRSKPESVSCPACAALLEVDGSTRLVKCGYCGGHVHLPDALWLSIHSGRRKRRWFVICEHLDEQ